MENHDTALFQSNPFQEDEGLPAQSIGESQPMDPIELGVIDPVLLVSTLTYVCPLTLTTMMKENYSGPEDTRRIDEPSSPERTREVEASTTEQPDA